MDIDTNAIKRSVLLNNRFGEYLPAWLFRMTRTPRFGFRARNILFALKYIHSNLIRGRTQFTQVAEFGVAQGEGFRQLVILTLHFCALRKIPPPIFHAFDTFEGMPKTTHHSDQGTWSEGDYPGDELQLRKLLDDHGLAKTCQLHKGLFSDTLPPITESFSPNLILVDCDYYTSTCDIFENLKSVLNSGTMVYFDDLGTNFYNRNMGEERFIHELNSGEFGKQYHLHHLFEKLYVWSNSDKPLLKAGDQTLHIPLKHSMKLESFY